MGIKIRDSKERMSLSYIGLTNLFKQQSSLAIMLAEFVDNSLSSWQNDGRGKSDLHIEITIDSRERIIKVSDDACGISKERFLKILKFGSEVENPKINRYGVGMKIAAFWLGEDVVIRTNNGKTIHEASIEISKLRLENRLNEDVEWNISANPAPREKVGTDIIIRNTSITNVSEEVLAKLVQTFETKYAPFLTKKFPSVSIVINHYQKNYGEKVINLLPRRISSQTIPYNSISTFVSEVTRGYSKKSPQILQDIKEQAIQKATDREPLVFEYKIPLKTFDSMVDKPKENLIIFHLGVLNEGKSGRFKDAAGIYAFEHDRAIRFPPNAFPFGKTDYTRTDIKRAYGIVDLSDVFMPTNNKTDFDYGGEDNEGLWFSLLKQIAEDFLPLCTAVKLALQSETIHERVDLSKKSLETTQNKLEEVTKDGTFEELKKEGTAEGKIVLTIPGTKLKKEFAYELSQYNGAFMEGENRNKILYTQGPVADKKNRHKIRIYYNASHRMWQSLLVRNREEMTAVMYPLIVLLGISAYVKEIKWMAQGEDAQLAEALEKVTNEEIYAAVADSIFR